MFDKPLVFVDVETTGSSPGSSRITEVAALRVDLGAQGEPTLSSFSTLVNPQQAIPAEIQALTGITPAMVRNAPMFESIAQALVDILGGAVFVAHHARFDYGFIKAELERAGVAWQAKTLCTVRLSRLLDPDRSPHGLDAVMSRYNLSNQQRHRAMGDAEVLWRLWQAWAQRKGLGTLHNAARLLLKQPSLPAHLPPDLLQSIPHGPGIYRFHGLNSHPLYIGKSVDLRQRVSSHFVMDHRSERGMRLASEVRAVSWESTAGELSALLREQQAISAEMPAHNQALRRNAFCFVHIDREQWSIHLEPPNDAACEPPNRWFGPFGQRSSARRILLDAAHQVGACAVSLGLERGRNSGPCFAHQVGKCQGGCVGKDPPGSQLERIALALQAHRWVAWPWPEHRAILQETSAHDGGSSAFLVDRWRVLDYKTSGGRGPMEIDSFAADAQARFHPGLYRLLSKSFLASSEPATDSPWLVRWFPVLSPAKPLPGAAHWQAPEVSAAA
jgi:DNA polymerase III subunit epsilon